MCKSVSLYKSSKLPSALRDMSFTIDAVVSCLWQMIKVSILILNRIEQTVAHSMEHVEPPRTM
jgi:hypothetical protein